MRIAYCEDERAQAVLTEDMIKSWAKERGQKCIVDVFSSAEQFLFELDGEELVPYDLLLLDISMIGMDGFTLAKQIRKTDMNIRIVFLTSDPSHVFDGYEIEAWRYMMKPVREQKLYEMLDILVTELADEKSHMFFWKWQGRISRWSRGRFCMLQWMVTTPQCIARTDS